MITANTGFTSPRGRSSGRLALLAGAALAIFATSGALAQTATLPGGLDETVSKVGPSPTSTSDVLKICASQNEAPFSAADGSGFENRIGVALAEGMGRKAEFVWTDKNAIYLVRDFLEKKSCDVVLGLDAGDERVLTSKSYYRTGYAFVSETKDGFTGTRWQDVDSNGMRRFSMRLHSPAETILKYAGKYEDNLAYLYSLVDFKSRRNQYSEVPPARIVSEVSGGQADLAIAFAPEVARYVKDSKGALKLTLIENALEQKNGITLPLQYDQAIGVRKGDDALLEAVNEGLSKAAPAIEAILTEEGIPLLPASS
ncbi:amino acid ABC transporter substrate-binding protein [Aureimonas sp. SA4125]|uniref:methanol oxidation system protein MoxJ n=1 Tax=Aureimonas sp. SA4125 TaxID=2826993 RepID=UPI001CC55F40|nr:methanol oxidation system protein MoxJ [Aureimonas sp. SA4125]BDA85151.1 amino acid ABC transporter substrate-binding protein [Aureimonas sp. SA4125]